MKIAVVGGDERFRHAAQWLKGMGHDVQWTGSWPEEYADAVLAVSEKEICGENFGCCFLQRGSAERKNVISLEENEGYLVKNAYLTAEGALRAVMGLGGRALFGAKCLVVGYGRIARALAQMLLSMRADVTAAVRPGKSAERARADGISYIWTDSLPKGIGSFEYIWNTAPERVIGEDALAKVREGAMLIDLASSPFGFELEDARSRNIWAERLSGLPGKYCPVTAGRVIAEMMENDLGEGKG